MSEQRTVVVVEDDDGMRRAVERLLAGAGVRLSCFRSAEALLQAGLPATAACLVLDVRLPGMSGFELAEKLAESGATPALIYITAHDEPAARARAKRLGAIAYLPKPFAGRLLVDAVAGVLKQP